MLGITVGGGAGRHRRVPAIAGTNLGAMAQRSSIELQHTCHSILLTWQGNQFPMEQKNGRWLESLPAECPHFDPTGDFEVLLARLKHR